MPSLPSLLLKIPDEFKPMAAIGIGSLILVLLALFHGISLHRILVLFKRGEIRLRTGRPHLGRAGLFFGWAIFLMLSLHILEIMTWAWFLVHLGLILRAADAIYFCANAYTTLGYGTVDLGVYWRNISPIIAISGLFTFAWTTSSLVSIVASYLKLVEQLEQERADQLALRAAARKAEWELLTKERESEGAARLDAKKQVAGLSFFARRKVWKEEKQKEQELRADERIEFERLRNNERLAEEKLGKGAPPDESEVNK